jgi:hypothetical protein
MKEEGADLHMQAARNHKPRTPPCARPRPYCPYGGCPWKTAIACCSCRAASFSCVGTELDAAVGVGVGRRVGPCVGAGVGSSGFRLEGGQTAGAIRERRGGLLEMHAGGVVSGRRRRLVGSGVGMPPPPPRRGGEDGQRSRGRARARASGDARATARAASVGSNECIGGCVSPGPWAAPLALGRSPSRVSGGRRKQMMTTITKPLVHRFIQP